MSYVVRRDRKDSGFELSVHTDVHWTYTWYRGMGWTVGIVGHGTVGWTRDIHSIPICLHGHVAVLKWTKDFQI